MVASKKEKKVVRTTLHYKRVISGGEKGQNYNFAKLPINLAFPFYFADVEGKRSVVPNNFLTLLLF